MAPSPSSGQAHSAGDGSPFTVASLKSQESLPPMSIQRFDGLGVVQVVQRVVVHYGVCVAFVALEGKTGLQLRARHGTSVRTVPLSSIARHWVKRELPIVIEDTAESEQFHADELVTGQNLRFYCAAPLMTSRCICVGCLVIMDSDPRPGFSLSDAGALSEAAADIMAVFRASSITTDLNGVEIPSLMSLPELCAGDAASVSSGSRTQELLSSRVSVFDTVGVVALVHAVQQHYAVSAAFLALEGEGELLLRARHGVDLRQVPLSSIARHWAAGDLPVIIEDASTDPDFCQDELLVGPPRQQLYVGVPLMLTPVRCIGCLAIMDPRPRHFTLDDANSLRHASVKIMDIYRNACGSKDLAEAVVPTWVSLPGLDARAVNSIGSLSELEEDPEELLGY